GTLAGDDAASDTKALAGGQITQFAGAANAHGIEPFAAVSHGVRADGESSAVEVGDQALFMVHGGERGAFIGLGVLFEQWAGGADSAFHLPEGVAAVKRVASWELRVNPRFLRASRSLGGRNDKGFTGHCPLTTGH